MDLSHLKVLVTGGAGVGVGGGVCEALDQFGASLIINDLSQKKANAAAKKYKNAIAIAADISKKEEVKALFKTIKKKVGPINGLVNNAGIGLTKPTHEVTRKEFDRLYDIDIRAVWMVSKYFVKQLLKNTLSGNIVNVSSVHAYATQPNYAIYASAKSAVEGFTRGLAYELGKHNIRCNAIAPGMVYAEQNYDLIKTWAEDPKAWEQGYINNQQVIPRLIQPIDCGNTVAFLLSDLSQSITGQTIYVDAGKTIMLFNRDFIE
jgi:NAD(P)-dependent dehydrogenase (short-subunit alcohol dehydrogenase family)